MKQTFRMYHWVGLFALALLGEVPSSLAAQPDGGKSTTNAVLVEPFTSEAC